MVFGPFFVEGSDICSLPLLWELGGLVDFVEEDAKECDAVEVNAFGLEVASVARDGSL